MQIEFTLDDTVAEFRRNWFMGRAELRIDGKVELLQNPLNPGTHFQLSLTRRWLLFNVRKLLLDSPALSYLGVIDSDDSVIVTLSNVLR